MAVTSALIGGGGVLGLALDAPSLRFLRETFARWAHNSERALLIADYQAPEDLELASLIDLDAPR